VRRFALAIPRDHIFFTGTDLVSLDVRHPQLFKHPDWFLVVNLDSTMELTLIELCHLAEGLILLANWI